MMLLGAVALASMAMPLEAIFADACFGGKVGLPRLSVAPIAVADLPRPIRLYRSNLILSSVYRISSPERGFLLTGTDAEDAGTKRCAIVSKRLSLPEIRTALLSRGFSPAGEMMTNAKPENLTLYFSFEGIGGENINGAFGWQQLSGGWYYAETIVKA